MELTLRGMARGFLPYTLDQRLLLPPDMRAWLPEGHAALFVSDVVDAMDLSTIYEACETGDDRGRAGYHPAMMTKLLVYGYCFGVTSSRRIERATQQDVAFRVLSGDQQPDHDSIATFRRRHMVALGELFVQMFELCREAGLVKLGHHAVDGTKMGADASKHKAMSYERMGEAKAKLEAEVQKLLEEAERVDAEEDALHGKGKRGDELPKELQRRESRLKKIQEAKVALEAEAKAKAEAKAWEAKAKLEERARKEQETGKKTAGRPPEVPVVEEAKPEPKAQRNFTDPESRIMPDGANKGSFLQGYNAQIAVDAEAQIIVAAEVTQQTNDKQQLEPMAKAIVASVGRLADVTSADAGYFSEEAIERVQSMGTELLVPPNRQKHGESCAEPFESSAPFPDSPSSTERMRQRLRTAVAIALYRMRKAIVEPVFGQIKGVRGLRRFALRGLVLVRAEWRFIAMTHNLLKLFRHGPGKRAAAT
jgi:transposase